MNIVKNKIMLCVLLVQFCIVIPCLADVIPMQREEVIQRSGLIFAGAVLEKSARWNDKGNLIVTDYVFRVDDVLFGQHKEKTIMLTFAGGQLPEEGQSVSDVPEFQVGDVVLLMVEESATPLFSPVTGMYQGKFTAAQVPGVAKRVALDGQNQPMLTETGQALGFEELINLVRNEIPVAKNKPLPDRSVPPELQKHVLQDLPVLPYDPRPSVQPPRVFAPEQPPANDAQLPNPKGGGENKSDEGGDQPLGPPATEWSYEHRAKDVPIVFNPWPDSFPGWLLHHDQFALSYWNVYADIYRVMEPTGSWAWRNDRYDMCGFPDNQTMIDQFGQGWGATTLAVCWIRWDGTGFSIEADIACNPAYSWTTDDYSTYDDPNLFNLDRTLTHEVGHSWGLNHQFNFLSVMNYAPKKYRAYNVIYMDDSSAVRAAFPSEAVSLSDLDVALFYSAGYQDYDDSDLSTQNVSPGDSMTVSNFVIENVGTVTMDPEIDWYLVPNINDWTGNRYIGSTTHATLAQSSWFLTSRTLTIPSGIPEGTYYLGAFVSNSSDEYISNNSSWLDRPIVVTVPPPNDNWADSIGISTFPTTVFGSNVNATEEPDEQHLGPAAATVWWFFQARNTGVITIDTFESDFDTMLHIYSGFENGFPNLVLEASNDDAGGGFQSEVTLPVVAGEFYEIRVAGYNGDEGDVVLNVSLVRPPNDYWADTIGISSLPDTVFGTNINATEEPDEQHLGPAAATVWWYVEAPANGTMTIDTFGSDFDTMLHIYTGWENGFPNLVLETSNDDAGGGLQSEVSFPVVANEYYEIRVAGFNGAEGNIALTVDMDVPPPGPTYGETLTVAPGIINSGGLPALEVSDNVSLVLFRDTASTAAVTQFVLTATSPTSTPTTFEFVLEGRCVSRPNVIQRVEFFNYVTGAYEVVDEQIAVRMPPDLSITVAPGGDLSRFVDPSTLAIQTRVRYRADSPRASFSSRTDRAHWMIQ